MNLRRELYRCCTHPLHQRRAGHSDMHARRGNSVRKKPRLTSHLMRFGQMNLSWKLSLVEHGLSPITLLSTYDEERLPVITDMLSVTTTTFDRIVSGQLETWAQELLTLRQFGVNYRWSSIVHDDKPSEYPVGTYGAFSANPQAGDRAPDAPNLIDSVTGLATSVLKIMAYSQHTALIFVDSTDSALFFLEELKSAPQGTVQPVIVLPRSPSLVFDQLQSHAPVLVDSECHAYNTYAPGEGRLVAILRPDGIIGALTSTGWGIREYLSHIFVMQ